MSEEIKNCNCGDICTICSGLKSPKDVSILDSSFWDLWIQKLLRNVASMKFQWLLLLYVPTIIGMFKLVPGSNPPEPWISAGIGLGFLGGGFVTLALGRIVAQTRLKENGNGIEVKRRLFAKEGGRDHRESDRDCRESDGVSKDGVVYVSERIRPPRDFDDIKTLNTDR